MLIGLLTACSCLGLGLARLALLDGPVTPFLVLAAWLFLELVDAWDGGTGAAHAPSGRARAWLAGAFVLSATAGILIKEPSVLLLPPLAAFFALERWGRRRPLPLIAAAVVLALPVVLSLAAWLLAAGGSAPFLETLRIVRETLATNAYAARRWGAYRYVLDFIVLAGVFRRAGVLRRALRALAPRRVRAHAGVPRRAARRARGGVRRDREERALPARGERMRARAALRGEFAALSARRLLVAGAIVGCVRSELASFQLIFVKYRTYETVSWNLFAAPHHAASAGRGR